MEAPEQQVYHDEDFMDEDGNVHGLKCCICKAVFVEGQPIAEQLDGFLLNTPIVKLVCVGCAMGAVHA